MILRRTDITPLHVTRFLDKTIIILYEIKDIAEATDTKTIIYTITVALHFTTGCLNI